MAPHTLLQSNVFSEAQGSNPNKHPAWLVPTTGPSGWSQQPIRLVPTTDPVGSNNRMAIRLVPTTGWRSGWFQQPIRLVPITGPVGPNNRSGWSQHFGDYHRPAVFAGTQVTQYGRESAAAEQQHEQRGNGKSDCALGGSIQKGSNEARI